MKHLHPCSAQTRKPGAIKGHPEYAMKKIHFCNCSLHAWRSE